MPLMLAPGGVLYFHISSILLRISFAVRTRLRHPLPNLRSAYVIYIVLTKQSLCFVVLSLLLLVSTLVSHPHCFSLIKHDYFLTLFNPSFLEQEILLSFLTNKTIALLYFIWIQNNMNLQEETIDIINCLPIDTVPIIQIYVCNQ